VTIYSGYIALVDFTISLNTRKLTQKDAEAIPYWHLAPCQSRCEQHLGSAVDVGSSYPRGWKGKIYLHIGSDRSDSASLWTLAKYYCNFTQITTLTVIRFIRAGLVVRQGYVPEKRRANRTQNSNLKHCISWGWVRGLTASSYIVYDYATSGYMDLWNI